MEDQNNHEEITKCFPCTIFELLSKKERYPDDPDAPDDEDDKRFKVGYRFKVVDFSRQAWYFVTHERMSHILTIQSMYPFTAKELSRFRHRGRRQVPWPKKKSSRQ